MLRFGILLTLVGAMACAHAKGDNTAATATESRVANARQVVATIVPFTTTEAALRTSLGTPTRDGVIHRQRVVSWIVSDQGAVKYLAVAVNGRGIVTDIYWDVPTEIPWTPEDTCGARQ